MRGIMLLAAAAAAFLIMPASGAHTEEWCGYATRVNSIIECGYSSDTECENAIGKGGMCFVDPEYALNTRRAAPAAAASMIVAKPSARRG